MTEEESAETPGGQTFRRQRSCNSCCGSFCHARLQQGRLPGKRLTKAAVALQRQLAFYTPATDPPPKLAIVVSFMHLSILVRGCFTRQPRASGTSSTLHTVLHCAVTPNWVMQVGANALQKALERLQKQAGNPAVVVGMEGGDDAALTQLPPPGKLLVHTVDFLRSFTEDPWLFGAITANHALGVSTSEHCRKYTSFPATTAAVTTGMPHALAGIMQAPWLACRSSCTGDRVFQGLGFRV